LLWSYRGKIDAQTDRGTKGKSQEKAQLYWTFRWHGAGDPGMTRTCDLRFRKPSLYPAELRDRRPALTGGCLDAKYQSGGVIASPGNGWQQKSVPAKFRRGLQIQARLFNIPTRKSYSLTSSEERAGNTDLILRSLRSKRLEGWTQRMDSGPSFETRVRTRSSG
jgi:hypothetical protein